MDFVSFYAPEEHVSAFRNLKKIPFAKTDDGYRFASWVCELNDTEENRTTLLESRNGKEAARLLDAAKQQLSEILVTEDDYLGWTIYKKDAGGIAKRHKIFQELSIELLKLAIDYTMEKITMAEHMDAEEMYAESTEQTEKTGRTILNRGNPFADVTIKSQQFFYKTPEGEAETLFFGTDNIVDIVDKAGKMMLTMRPGFSVAKEHGVVKKPMQKVIFSNNMTEPIIEDEDHIYIYID